MGDLANDLRNVTPVAPDLPIEVLQMLVLLIGVEDDPYRYKVSQERAAHEEQKRLEAEEASRKHQEETEAARTRAGAD